MDDENIPYRSPVTEMLNSSPVRTTPDEIKYDTLRSVGKILQEAVDSLYKDFNAFSIGKDNLPAKRAGLILYEVDVRQGVYDIVAPLLESVISAIGVVDDNYKQRQG